MAKLLDCGSPLPLSLNSEEMAFFARGKESRLHLVHGDDAEDFFEAGMAGSYPAQTVLPHSLHSLTDGDFLQGPSRHLLQNGIAKDFIGHEQLCDSRAPLESGVHALAAACAAPKFG